MSGVIRGRSDPFVIWGGVGAAADGAKLVTFGKYNGNRCFVHFNGQPVMLQDGTANSRKLRFYDRPVVASFGNLAVVEEVIGLEQTPQDVKSSRATDTIYQNTTGKPIFVQVQIASQNGGFLEISADATNWVTLIKSTTASFTYGAALVPNGYYYRLRGSVSVNYWSELR